MAVIFWMNLIFFSGIQHVVLYLIFAGLTLNWVFAIFVVCGKNPPTQRAEQAIRVCSWIFVALHLIALIVLQSLTLVYDGVETVYWEPWRAATFANLILVNFLR